MKGNTVAYDNEGKGALFRAKEKKTDKHPDYDGTLTIDGQEYWLSGWQKQSANGVKYLSLSVKPKQQPEIKRPSQDAAKARQITKPAADDFDDQIPF